MKQVAAERTEGVQATVHGRVTVRHKGAAGLVERFTLQFKALCVNHRAVPGGPVNSKPRLHIRHAQDTPASPGPDRLAAFPSLPGASHGTVEEPASGRGRPRGSSRVCLSRVRTAARDRDHCRLRHRRARRRAAGRRRRGSAPADRRHARSLHRAGRPVRGGGHPRGRAVPGVGGDGRIQAAGEAGPVGQRRRGTARGFRAPARVHRRGGDGGRGHGAGARPEARRAQHHRRGLGRLHGPLSRRQRRRSAAPHPRRLDGDRPGRGALRRGARHRRQPEQRHHQRPDRRARRPSSAPAACRWTRCRPTSSRGWR